MRIINHYVTPLAILGLCVTGGVFADQTQPSAGPAFASANEAVESLYQAVQKNDEQAIANILGGPTELTVSDDRGLDKAERDLFLEKYREMHRVGREPDGSATLYIGAENWPFPVPLVNQNGAWRFDPEAGKKEVLHRRIGENELIAIANCDKFASAEERYTAAPEDPTNSAPNSLVAKAASGSASADPILIDGYYFRLVPVQSAKKPATRAVALIAYPAEYRSTGVMTFVVTKHGLVYEKDLGADTKAQVNAMSVFRKDGTWRPVSE